jgi:hypothetical protein
MMHLPDLFAQFHHSSRSQKLQSVFVTTEPDFAKNQISSKYERNYPGEIWPWLDEICTEIFCIDENALTFRCLPHPFAPPQRVTCVENSFSGVAPAKNSGYGTPNCPPLVAWSLLTNRECCSVVKVQLFNVLQVVTRKQIVTNFIS